MVGSQGKTQGIVYQLAVNKDGIIQGNCCITSTSENLAVQSSVDNKTQRAAWHVVTDKNYIVETGLYNLTKDEVPVLVHIGPATTGQVLLVRIKNDEAGSSGS